MLTPVARRWFTAAYRHVGCGRYNVAHRIRCSMENGWLRDVWQGGALNVVHGVIRVRYNGSAPPSVGNKRMNAVCSTEGNRPGEGGEFTTSPQ